MPTHNHTVIVNILKAGHNVTIFASDRAQQEILDIVDSVKEFSGTLTIGDADFLGSEQIAFLLEHAKGTLDFIFDTADTDTYEE